MLQHPQHQPCPQQQILSLYPRLQILSLCPHLPFLSLNDIPLLHLASTRRIPPPLLPTYLTMNLQLNLHSLPQANDWHSQLVTWPKKTKVIGKTSLNSLLHSRIGMPLKMLSSGNIRVPGNPLYHWPIWMSSWRRNQSRRSSLLTTMPSSIENLGGWKHDWKRRRKYQISASTRPMKVAFIPTCATRSCFTCMTKRLHMREARLSK